MDDEKVMDTQEWPEDGEYADVIACLHKIAEIICMASQVTDEFAKKSLFQSAEILITNCKDALATRTEIEPVIEEED